MKGKNKMKNILQIIQILLVYILMAAFVGAMIVGLPFIYGMLSFITALVLVLQIN